MHIQTIVTGPFRENAYLIWENGGDAAVMIDPGDEAHLLQKAILSEQLQLGLILVTHAHLDHVGAVAELRAFSGAVVCVPAGERESLAWLPESYRFFGLPVRPVPEVDHWLPPELTDLGNLLSPRQRGGLDITAHATPGHTAGGTSYQVGNHCFVGDTLFRDSVGRTDLPGGDWPLLQSSLRRLMNLPAGTIVHPGHGEPTTIGREREANPFILGLEDQAGLHA